MDLAGTNISKNKDPELEDNKKSQIQIQMFVTIKLEK